MRHSYYHQKLSNKQPQAWLYRRARGTLPFVFTFIRTVRYVGPAGKGRIWVFVWILFSGWCPSPSSPSGFFWVLLASGFFSRFSVAGRAREIRERPQKGTEKKTRNSGFVARRTGRGKTQQEATRHKKATNININTGVDSQVNLIGPSR
jgi:hypothetical protein